MQRDDIDYARVFTAAPTPFVLLDPELTILDVNEAHLAATGRCREELVGKHVFDAFPADPGSPDEDGVANMRASLERARDSGQADTMAVQRYDIPVPGTGEFLERYWSPVNVPILDDHGNCELLLHRVEDVTDFVLEGRRGRSEPEHNEDRHRRMLESEADVVARARQLQELNRELREARDQLAARLVQDPLTGLLVRWVFLEQVSSAVARLARHPQPVAVLFIDLDRLKPINDVYGHAAGDELIRCCAERLRAGVRPSDPVARIGGDEFVVLLRDLHDAAEAASVAERLLEQLRSPCRLQSGPLVRPSASIGGAVTDDADTAADDLVARADAAMYRAKQSGGDRVEVFDARDHPTHRDGLETELREAFSHEQFVVHYQPVVDVITGRLHGVEARLCWKDPTGGLLAVGDLAAVLADSDLVVEIGAWVTSTACEQLAAWDAAFPGHAPTHLFLGLSIAELEHAGLQEQVAGAVSRVGVDGRRLVFQVTEELIDQAARRGVVVDERLPDRCQLAITGFGTGSSSLARSVTVRADILKIDRASMGPLHDDEWAAIVSAALALAHDLDKSVVVEGVDDAATLTMLTDRGCTYMQGRHIAPPQPADDLTGQLEDWVTLQRQPSTPVGTSPWIR